MALTEHQKTIISFCNKNNGTITKKQACDLIRYYCNTEKHVGDILSRMVKSNLLKRLKPGIFELSSGLKQEIKIENQTELF